VHQSEWVQRPRSVATDWRRIAGESSAPTIRSNYSTT